jgi:hypothetical protein
MERAQRLAGRGTRTWAAAVPLLCAAHCLGAPLAVSLAPALALPAAAEPLVQAATLLFAGWLGMRGVAVHGRRAVFAPMAAGVALWIAGALAEGYAASAEQALVIAGSLAIAGGLWWNGRLRHDATCRACGCGAHASD